MLKTILLLLLCVNIFALEISLQGAKEKHEAYSTLHLKDKNKFLCQEFKDDFDSIVKIVCAFEKSPSQKIQKLQNSFFEIETQTKKKTFFLVIKPYKKMKLFPIVFDLTKDETTFSSNIKISNHWLIVGYKDEIPYIKKHTPTDITINFPFTFGEDKLPYVGSLDIKGNPVHVKRVGDVTDYIKIKKLYKDKNYEFCLELINDIMRDYPNSLFTAELLFYKMRVYFKLKDYDQLIEVSKVYLREYSSDENIPEVLSMTAYAYNKIGLSSDSDYFFDRLFSEHPASLYAKWGYIYMGEIEDSSGSAIKARALYKKALVETDNIDVAVEAAFKLTQNYISISKIKPAAEYIAKVVKSKPEYFAQNMNISMDMMYNFIDNSDYISAASIAESIFEHINSNYDEYEELARDVGIWLSKSENKKGALKALNRYLKLFSDGGEYSEEVQVAKDSLFFDINDENTSVKLAGYDKLIDEYDGDSIGDKAIYEKAKLLIASGMFIKALDLEQQLLNLDTEEYKDIPKLITNAAIGTMKQALKTKECSSVLVISKQYKIELSNEWDDGIYACAMKGADFVLAKKMAEKNLQSRDVKEREKWLYRYIKVDFATGNYSNVIEASKELITLIDGDKKSKYIDIYRYLFDTYHRLENSDKMISAISDLQKVYKDDYLDIDRYVAMMAVGSDKKDSNLVIEYGKKVMNIQKISNSHAQSPFVEFTLYQAYIEKENNNEALDVIQSLDSVKLNKSDRARQKYLLGSVLDKLWRNDDAQQAYQESIDADKDSAWAKLAQGAKEI